MTSYTALVARARKETPRTPTYRSARNLTITDIFMREIEVAAIPRLFQLAGYREVTFSNEGCFSLGRSSRESGRKEKSFLSAQLLPWL